MRNFEVKKAEPINTYVRIALVGAAGSGKTFSALRLASGMGGKIVLIDTENRRSSKYASKFSFYQIDLQPPFNPRSYGEAIEIALSNGAETIIIDSLSHEHEGEGGVLAMAEDFLQKKAGDDWKKRENMKFASWIAPKRERTSLIVDTIQRVNANIILCFRAKEVTKPVRNAQGKIEPIKEWDMIGGDEYRYEMDVTAFLPSGSEGVPDWSNSMKRINDSDGSLKKFLMSAGQLNEEAGRQIKAMNTVVAPLAPPQPLKTPEQELASKLSRFIREVQVADDLKVFWRTATGDLEIIKKNSNTAYDHLEKMYNSKLEQLSKCSTCDGTGVIEEEADGQSWKEPCPSCSNK